MDITGARWGLHTAEAVLKLRALISNATSTPIGTFTSPKNTAASTHHATPSVSSPKPYKSLQETCTVCHER
jgi:hypothetical protein